MALKQVLEIVEFLDRPAASAADVAELLANRGVETLEVETVSTEKGSTGFIKIHIPIIKPDGFDQLHERGGIQHRLKDAAKWQPLGIGSGEEEPPGEEENIEE